MPLIQTILKEWNHLLPRPRTDTSASGWPAPLGQQPELPAVRAVVGREVEALSGGGQLHGSRPGRSGGDVLDEPRPLGAPVAGPQLHAMHLVTGTEIEPAAPNHQPAGVRAEQPGRDVAHQG